MVSKNVNKTAVIVLCKLILMTFYGCPSSVTESPDLIKQPDNVTGSIQGNRILLTWNPTDNAKYYAVYKKEVGTQWVLVSDLISSNSYLLTSVEYDKEFYYGVSAKSLEIESEISSTNRTFNLTSTCINVTGVKVKSLQLDNGIILSWDELKNNISYHIYRSEVETDQGDEVVTTTGLTYTDILTSTNNLRADTVYYYRILWTDNSNGTTGGGSMSPVSGFYSINTDTREPNDNDKELVLSENLALVTINSVLFKKEGNEDIDWYRHIVPSQRTHNLLSSGLSGFGVIKIFKNDIYLETKSSDATDIILENSTLNDAIYYFQVLPVTGVADFIEPYTLTINNSF